MSRALRLLTVLLVVLVATAAVPALADDAQRRGAGPRAVPPPAPAHRVVTGGQVFIGGYFYDPFWGPYPWWPRHAYPYWYYPVYDDRSELRLDVEPEEVGDEAAVYVDGFYAGVVDDFDGIMQGLFLTPGGHTIVIYLDGYRTRRHNVHLSPASSFKLHDTLERLPEGVASEPPTTMPAVPAPPEGTYSTPRTQPPAIPGAPAPATAYVAGFGTLELHVQPNTATVTIDGHAWASSEPGHFDVQLPVGRHKVEVTQDGYQRFARDIEVRDGAAVPLNVSLQPGS